MSGPSEAFDPDRRHLRGLPDTGRRLLQVAGIDRTERVLTDNARPYRRNSAWRQALAGLGAAGKYT